MTTLTKTLEPGVYAFVVQLAQTNATLVETVATQNQNIAALTAQIADLREMLFGRKSEKLPPMGSEVRRAVEESELFPEPLAASLTNDERSKRRRKHGRKKSKVARKERRALRKNLPVLRECVLVTPTELPEGMTPDDFREVGEQSNVIRRIEHVREHLVSVEYVLQTLVSKDNEHIVTAKAPPSVIEGGHYGPGVYAHAVVSKCNDSLPLYRIERIFARAGLSLARSTLCTLFHRSAELMGGIYDRLLELAKRAPYVGADETRQPVTALGGCQTGWIWTLHCDEVIAYVFSDSRSSQIAKQLLAGTTGYLQVDGYSAYNSVCGDGGRKRVGCWSHARRLFFKALPDDDAAKSILNWIVDLYLVEYEAAHQGTLGNAHHLELRQAKSIPIVDKIKAWLDERKDLYPPKSRLGKAIQYTLNQWAALTIFTKDPCLRLDNNVSENALRIIALGRKNFLFVGHEEGGKNLAVLQTIVATCCLHGVNPYAYIKDVLIRVQTHPQSKIDDLLPQHWKSLFATSI